ncbi:penicillin-insensitive murein endopeptidase [Shigella flexneri]
MLTQLLNRQLCLDAGNDRDWLLRKVRRWFRHRAHMPRIPP